MGPRRVGLVERDRVGQDETAFGCTCAGVGFCLSRTKIGIFQSAFFPSLSVTVLSLFTKLVSNLEKLLFLSFFNYLCLLALFFAQYGSKSRSKSRSYCTINSHRHNKSRKQSRANKVGIDNRVAAYSSQHN